MKLVDVMTDLYNRGINRGMRSSCDDGFKVCLALK
jgi:hypothetical protein